MSESGRENRDRQERQWRDFENSLMEAESDAKARAAENSKRDRVESAVGEGRKPGGSTGGCLPSREAPVSEATSLTRDKIYWAVHRVLNEREASALSNHELAASVAYGDRFKSPYDIPASGAASGTVQVSTGPLQTSPGGGVRSFPTGATRSSSEGKPDYEGYLSPLVIERYGQFMLKHQVQADGTRRPSDNWQRGIPIEEYMKSLFRHFVDVWKKHRGWDLDAKPEDFQEALCAIIFNASGILHEVSRKGFPE